MRMSERFPQSNPFFRPAFELKRSSLLLNFPPFARDVLFLFEMFQLQLAWLLFSHYSTAGMSKVRPAGQIRPSVKFCPARSLVMKYITLVYCYLASSINMLHLPTRDQQHFTQHNPQAARIHGQWFSTRILT